MGNGGSCTERVWRGKAWLKLQSISMRQSAAVICIGSICNPAVLCFTNYALSCQRHLKGGRCFPRCSKSRFYSFGPWQLSTVKWNVGLCTCISISVCIWQIQNHLLLPDFFSICLKVCVFLWMLKPSPTFKTLKNTLKNFPQIYDTAPEGIKLFHLSSC